MKPIAITVILEASMILSFEDIQSAAQRIRGGVLHTPCSRSAGLSELTGLEVYCKREYLQKTGSFKERGALNALQLLADEQKKRGMIAASAGNHALALSYHGKQLGVPVTVVMPEFAALNKVVQCERAGANVILHGKNLEEARERATRLAQQRGLVYVNGYDDPTVIAGQGTLGLEIVEQVPDLDAVIVPVGVAGLIAGFSLAVKTLKPSVTIIGVEPEGAASYSAGVKAGQPVAIQTRATLADGLAVPCVGANAFQIARRYVDRQLQVSERDIELAVLRLGELEKAVVEGAGAIPLAACLAGLLPEMKRKKVVLLLCGGNIDTPVLGRIIERGLAADGRLCRFTAMISDRPGGLAQFAAVVAQAGASFIDIVHDRTFAGDDIGTVTIHCVIETRDAAHAAQLRERLASEGFSCGSATWGMSMSVCSSASRAAGDRTVGK